MDLAAAVGILAATWRKVMTPSWMGHGCFARVMSSAVDGNRDAHKFTRENAAKDIGCLDASADAQVMTIIAADARHDCTQAAAGDHGADYVPHPSDHVARLNGIDLRP